jgi:hypothetical protein
MRVLLLQMDGKIPNLALLRIAGYHRDRGDEVELRQLRHPNGVERGLFDTHDKVYASLIFEKTRPLAERLLKAQPGVTVGGTGWRLESTLAGAGIPEDAPPDYSLYPNFRQSLGFTQRGCRLKCPFCVVPRKEGAIRPTATVNEIWRGEPWPKELLLLDNDFFGQPHWRERIAEVRDGGFKVSFNQGINARFLTDEAAEAIASVQYRDDSMRDRRLYTAWDNRKDEWRLFAGLNRLVKYGVKPAEIMVYMLIGYWPGETEGDWEFRRKKLREFGAMPYPMPYVRDPVTIAYQCWVIRRYDLKVPWEEFRRAKSGSALKGQQRRERDGRQLFPLELTL